MPGIVLVTTVPAPVERVFDLSLDVGLHVRTATGTRERIVGGRTEGLLAMGEEVTWSARHFLLRWEMTVRITGHERPRWFRDEMVEGPFASFRHDHFFESVEGGTRVQDEITFRMRGGSPGRLVGSLLVAPHFKRFVERRNRLLGEVAAGRSDE